MDCQHYGNKDGLTMSESDLYTFSAELNEWNNLSDFGYACAYMRYQNMVAFLTNQAKKHKTAPYQPMSWDKWKARFLQYPLTRRTFLEKQCYCILGMENVLAVVPEEQVRAAMILEDEWDSVFIIAQLNDSYVGYWWETGA